METKTPVFISDVERANNPAGADCCEISVVLQRLFTAAQQEHYAS